MSSPEPAPDRTRVPEVRKATRSDASALAEMLGRAFFEDPVIEWVFRDESRRLARARRYFAGRLRVLLPQDECYTTPDLAGAALWARPDEWHDPPLMALWQVVTFAPGIGTRALEVLRGLRAVEARHPAKPHWYLAVLGTEPDRQGEGVGSAVIQPVLNECDRLDVPAYLETARERNVDFYTRQGFRVTDELRLPDGPMVWLMWRDPRP
jgi:GNAT superfamily N-acetyltransferase